LRSAPNSPQANPAAYRPDVATALNNLGILDAREQRFAEARQAVEEALRIYEEFAATSPAQFGARVDQLRFHIAALSAF
jgi:hypothetical protein